MTTLADCALCWFSDRPSTSNILLPSSRSSVTLSGLRPFTNYSVLLSTANECARSSPAGLNFLTRPRMLYPNAYMLNDTVLNRVLTGLVLFLWLSIVGYFIHKCNKITFATSMPTCDYWNRKNTQQGSKRRDSVVSGTVSVATAASKHSGVNQFDLLEEAVCNWRSETVLSSRIYKGTNIWCSDEKSN
jgi:hypothetical protein